MNEIQVKLEPPYVVRVGHDLLASIVVPHARVALLVDSTVLETHAPILKVSLESSGSHVTVHPLPTGEACKTLTVHARLLSELAQHGLTRDAAIIALGGGATSDLAGYVAASYLRGIAFYVCPTTLLAMVDASIGGKTGVNLPEGKNLVGAFHQPRAVWADLNTLNTLPERIFREGAAETFKHGLLTNGTLCGAVLQPGFNAGSQLEKIVTDAIQVKASIVTRDPFEAGERAFLNFGHTLAHALEAITRHELPHGEAVGYGMHYAAFLSKELGYADLTDHTQAFLAYQKPAKLPKLEYANVAPFMARDKKADSNGVRFVVLEDIGRAKLERVPEVVQIRAWNAFMDSINP